MADASAVHSNATNFQSFVQNHVDQRTGQYALGIDLQLPTGNDLTGPGLPLRIAFSPFDDTDSGFGKGWQLAMTQYVPATRMLTLHTGESYKVTGTGPQPAIREKKIHSFYFHDDGEGGKGPYRVVHKSGLVEVLTVHDVVNPIALPTSVIAPSGHAITLSYTPEMRRLHKVVDDAGTPLLELDYSDAGVTIDSRPRAGDSGQPLMRYTLVMNNRELVEVKLPSDVGGNWRFAYRTVHGLKCITKVSTPTGAVEEIRYGENGDPGHLLPGTRPQRALPRVTSHEVKPRADQPPLKTTYTYKYKEAGSEIEVEHSFVGSNSTVSWRDDGEDNLYRAPSTYRYSVTAHYWKAGRVARRQKQTFNRYHLLTQQTLEEDGHLEQTDTVFHEQPGLSFDDQWRYFQLPSTITKSWKLLDDPETSHVETASTSYDEYGNVIEETSPTGVRTVYQYYDKLGEKDGDAWLCPPDPQDFVRNVKSKTVYPVADMPGGAPVQRSRMTYKALPTLPGPGLFDEWLVPCGEQVVQVVDVDLPAEREQLLIGIERVYLCMPDNAFLHGRPAHQIMTRYGENCANPVRRAIESRSTCVKWTYSRCEDAKHGLEYWTDETVSGFDLTQRTSRMAVSALHGQVVYESDDYGNSVRRRYDRMARLIEEIVAPGQSEDEASSSYGYGLVYHSEDGTAGLATQSFTGSTGVTTFRTFDGCSRTLWDELEVSSPQTTASSGKDTRQRKLISQYQYDELGRLIESTSFDYDDSYTDGRLALTSTFDYDAWGRLCKTTSPNGTAQLSDFSPFGNTGDIVTQWLETPDQPGIRQHCQVLESNRFDKPAQQYRLDDSGNKVGRRELSYDGLGRCISETQVFNHSGKPVTRTSAYTYDSEGRITRHERPDQSAMLSQFALHSAEALAEKLLVEPRKGSQPTLAWERGYDGLSRLVSLAAGLQKESYAYKANTSLLETRTTAQRAFTYHYRPTRSAQPTRIEVNNQNSEYDYSPQTAAISTASNSLGTHSYRYNDLGYLHETHWQAADGSSHRCNYRTSLLGMPLGYSESDGLEVQHVYDALGQLTETRQGDLIANFKYDALGRLTTTTTQDLANQQVLECEQHYDALGREEGRLETLTRPDGSTITHAIAMTWREDDQLHTRTLTRDGRLMLKETFDYDALDRLEQHVCEGSSLPRNAAGRAIIDQFFIYDELNNLTECFTSFADGSSDAAKYDYNGFILLEATHSLQPDYPARQVFEHDDEGNLLNDEQGNRLVYDDHGRLSEVQRASDGQPLYRYRYDGHSDLVGVRHEQAAEVTRRYQGYRLSGTREGDVLTEYFYAGARPLGMQRPAQKADNRLFLTNSANSVVGECSCDQLQENAYTAYGESPDNGQLLGLLGFNGEVRERALGWSLLGRGYRAYNPGLMRFHSPDTAAPEMAGINPYVYCGGNPVNWRDPTGHYGIRNSMESPYIPPVALKPKGDWRSWVGVALGAVFAVVSLMFMPPMGLTWAFAFGASSLAIDVAATAVSAAAVATGNAAANDWAFWLGIASAVSSLGLMMYSRLMARAGQRAASVGTQTDEAIPGILSDPSGPNVTFRRKPEYGPQDIHPSKNFNTQKRLLWKSRIFPKSEYNMIVHKTKRFSWADDDSFITDISLPSSRRSSTSSISSISSRESGTGSAAHGAPPDPTKTFASEVETTAAPSYGSILGYEKRGDGFWVAGGGPKSFIPYTGT